MDQIENKNQVLKRAMIFLHTQYLKNKFVVWPNAMAFLVHWNIVCMIGKQYVVVYKIENSNSEKRIVQIMINHENKKYFFCAV